MPPDLNASELGFVPTERQLYEHGLISRETFLREYQGLFDSPPAPDNPPSGGGVAFFDAETIAAARESLRQDGSMLERVTRRPQLELQEVSQLHVGGVYRSKLTRDLIIVVRIDYDNRTVDWRLQDGTVTYQSGIEYFLTSVEYPSPAAEFGRTRTREEVVERPVVNQLWNVIGYPAQVGQVIKSDNAGVRIAMIHGTYDFPVTEFLSLFEQHPPAPPPQPHQIDPGVGWQPTPVEPPPAKVSISRQRRGLIRD